jgi:hypothetical protein
MRTSKRPVSAIRQISSPFLEIVPEHARQLFPEHRALPGRRQLKLRAFALEQNTTLFKRVDQGSRGT